MHGPRAGAASGQGHAKRAGIPRLRGASGADARVRRTRRARSRRFRRETIVKKRTFPVGIARGRSRIVARLNPWLHSCICSDCRTLHGPRARRRPRRSDFKIRSRTRENNQKVIFDFETAHNDGGRAAPSRAPAGRRSAEKVFWRAGPSRNPAYSAAPSTPPSPSRATSHGCRLTVPQLAVPLRGVPRRG